MVLVAENAAYHHKRMMGSLASLTKKNLIDSEMMAQHEVQYIDLPLTESRFEHANDDNVLYRGDCLRTSYGSFQS
jgi:hypothetical protein